MPSPLVARILDAPWSRRDYPKTLPSLALWLDAQDPLTFYKTDGSRAGNGDAVALVADKSGNSAVNCLVLNGASGQYASQPSAAPVKILSDITLLGLIAANDYTAAANEYIISKIGAIGDRSYGLRKDTTGVLTLVHYTDGTTGKSASSTAATSGTDFGLLWVAGTLDADNGAGGWDVKFYTAPFTGSYVPPAFPAGWTQLGTTVTTATATSIYDSTAPVEYGAANAGTITPLAGRIYAAQIINGYDGAGTVQAFPNFTTFAKLAATGTESSANAATVTINSTGATGARISGARDLYQGTVANQPVLTIAATGNYLTFNGTTMYVKSPAFALAQPETVYFVGSQVTWTVNDTLIDGGTALSGAIFQALNTPGLKIYAGSTGTENANLPVATNGIVTAVINNTSPSLRINRGAVSAGTVGASNMNGVTIGARGDGTSNPSNITVSELLVYAAAHEQPQQDNPIRWLGRLCNIVV